MYYLNCAVESGPFEYREIKGKGGFIGIGFDAKMFALDSREDVKKFLDFCLEDWKVRHPKANPSEIRYEICSRVNMIVGGRAYTGYLYFKPL